MCGIVGIVARKKDFGLYKDDVAIFNNLLYCSGIRGKDSTGIMVWDGTNVHTLKTTYTPEEFLYSKEYERFMKSIPKVMAIFGHTRLATSGKITSNNSHPFKVKDITLVHNGAVTYALGENIKKYDVDSMALAHSISKNDTVEALKAFSGAIASVWFDNRHKTINFYRNSLRPMSYAENWSCRFFASEGPMLDWVVKRHEWYKSIEIKQLPDRQLAILDMNNLENDFKKIEIPYTYTATPSYSPFSDDDINDRFSDAPLGMKKFLSSFENLRKQPVALPAPKQETDKVTPINDFVLSMGEYGPFKKGEQVTLLAYDKEPMSNGRFRVLCAPVVTTIDNRPQVQGATCIVVAGTEERAEQIFQSEVIKGTIKSIRYNRMSSVPDKDRVLMFVGDVEIVNKGTSNG